MSLLGLNNKKEKKPEFIVMNSQLEVFSGLAFGGVPMFSKFFENAKPLDDEAKFHTLRRMCYDDTLMMEYIN
jgi:hypothetical protein